MPIPLLPAPTAKSREHWDLLLKRDAHFRQYGYPDWEKRHGESVVSKTYLGRQLVAGHYTRNGKYNPSALHIELSIDEDHLVVPTGRELYKRLNRMADSLQQCEERQILKATKTPAVIALPAPSQSAVVPIAARTKLNLVLIAPCGCCRSAISMDSPARDLAKWLDRHEHYKPGWRVSQETDAWVRENFHDPEKCPHVPRQMSLFEVMAV